MGIGQDTLKPPTLGTHSSSEGELPHCRLMDLYFQFCAEYPLWQTFDADLGNVPSLKTFQRVFVKLWSKLLTFGPKTDHKQCNFFFDSRRIMHSSTATWAEKVKAAQELREHWAETYLDRTLYWGLRFASCMLWNVLVIIMDDMGLET